MSASTEKLIKQLAVKHGRKWLITTVGTTAATLIAALLVIAAVAGAVSSLSSNENGSTAIDPAAAAAASGCAPALASTLRVTASPTNTKAAKDQPGKAITTPATTSATASAGSAVQAAAYNVPTGCTPCGRIDIDGVAVGTVIGLTAEQNTNAQIIAKVALARGLGRAGVLTGVVTAYTEASLINVGHGDASGPSSVGLFQQMPSWGPLAVRTDPAGAAGLFFDAVIKIAGWQELQAWDIAQQVEGSEYDGKTDWAPGVLGGGRSGVLPYAQNYKQNMAQGQSVTDQLMESTPGATTSSSITPTTSGPSVSPTAVVLQAAVTTAATTTTGDAAAGRAASCGTGGGGVGTVKVDGPRVTIPTDANVDPALQGKVVTAPNAQIAAGLAWSFTALGVDYVYGGGGLGSKSPGGPDDGCARAGGDRNSCKGLIGYDCSGLSWTVLDHMNPSLQIPYGASDAMSGGGVKVDLAKAVPGDLVTYGAGAGGVHHVAVSLGYIDGRLAIIEAPDVGLHVRIKFTTSSDIDSWVNRYWSSS